MCRLGFSWHELCSFTHYRERFIFQIRLPVAGNIEKNFLLAALSLLIPTERVGRCRGEKKGEPVIMKKIFCFGALLAFYVLSWAPSAHAISLGFVPASQTLGIGDSVAVDVVISDLNAAGEIVSTYDLDVNYDPSILSATGVALEASWGIHSSSKCYKTLTFPCRGWWILQSSLSSRMRSCNCSSRTHLRWPRSSLIR